VTSYLLTLFGAVVGSFETPETAARYVQNRYPGVAYQTLVTNYRLEQHDYSGTDSQRTPVNDQFAQCLRDLRLEAA